MIASSPAFRSGKKPLGACAMKYATAMSPARMNATGRVNKPSTISTPPTSSIMPLMPERDIGATPVEGETGKLKYFDVPCSRNSRPTMIRKILSTRGDHWEHVAKIASASLRRNSGVTRSGSSDGTNALQDQHGRSWLSPKLRRHGTSMGQVDTDALLGRLVSKRPLGGFGRMALG